MSIAAKHAYRYGFLKSEKWQNIRLEVLAKKDANCDICGHRDLSNDVHHVWYGHPWESTPQEYLMVLCRKCHEHVHLKIESPEAKMVLFMDIRREFRKELGLKKQEYPGWERNTEAPKELRAAFEDLKRRHKQLAETGKPEEKKIREKKPVIQGEKEIIVRICRYCPSEATELLDLFKFLPETENTNDRIWKLRLCLPCKDRFIGNLPAVGIVKQGEMGKYLRKGFPDLTLTLKESACDAATPVVNVNCDISKLSTSLESGPLRP